MGKGSWIWLVVAALFIGSAINVGLGLDVTAGQAVLLSLLGIAFVVVFFFKR
jgi:hypothetical protein